MMFSGVCPERSCSPRTTPLSGGMSDSPRVFGFPFYCITQKQSKMVKIISYQTRQNKEGDKFVTLQFQGDITMVQSKETGSIYLKIGLEQC
jgi:hypothetical protein